jgi:putative toxin-antitoxin system antitoxin component (TIGR02293 family)
MPNVLEATANDITAAEKSILQGIAWSEAEHLGTLLGVPINRLAAILQIAPATMQRRKTAGRFPVDESERIVRFARIWFLACQALGGAAGARSWLFREQHGLSGRIPVDVARLEIGARSVESLLHRIDYGILA